MFHMFHEKFSSLDGKIDFYLTTRASTFTYIQIIWISNFSQGNYIHLLIPGLTKKVEVYFRLW